MIDNLYKKRDIEALDTYFLKHLSAMTTEELKGKSDIAAELAYRDERINELEEDKDSWRRVAERLEKEKQALTAQGKDLQND